jgi:thiol peroxidase
MARQTTLRGNPLPLEGPEIKVGDTAPDAKLCKDLVNETQLSAYKGKTRIVSVVPSLDTPVCAMQTKRFNEEAAKLPSVTFITISADLPPAQARFCGAEKIDKEKLIVLSDHRYTDFGKKYGTLVPGLRILSRAVFVIGPDDKVKYAEYVPEIAEHPKYDAVLAAAKS